MAWLGPGGLSDLAADLKEKTELEPENIEIEKIDDETMERLKKSTNLNDKEIETRHEEFNKLFPNRKGGNLAIMLEDFCQKTVKTKGTQGDLTLIFPKFSNPIPNLNFYINADPWSA
jgi:hypothetical protein